MVQALRNRQRLAVPGCRLIVVSTLVREPAEIVLRGRDLGRVPLPQRQRQTLVVERAGRIYVVRLLNHMAAHGYRRATPRPRNPGQSTEPLFGSLTSGYVLRSQALFPKQGEGDPWRIHQNYLTDIRLLLRADVNQDMEFSALKSVPAPVELAA